jgi:hypothetical protein
MPSKLVLGPTQPTVQWVVGILSLEVKWQEREANQSPPTCVEISVDVYLYINTLIRFHGVTSNYLSIRAILFFARELVKKPAIY